MSRQNQTERKKCFSSVVKCSVKNRWILFLRIKKLVDFLLPPPKKNKIIMVRAEYHKRYESQIGFQGQKTGVSGSCEGDFSLIVTMHCT